MIKTMEQLSHYVLIEKLGSGSAGIVYKAQDRRQGRIVALKVLRKNQPAKALEQFQREINYTSKLNDKTIVRFNSVETLADGQTLLVMPFIEGKTLDKLLIPLPLQEVLTIMEQIATTLLTPISKT